MSKSKPGPATQRYLDIAEIRDDMVLLKDGTVRGVLLASSINFALKSHDEQQAIIQAYMQFLNGLEHPIQIVIQSRKMNIDLYISELQEQWKKQANDLLKTQIQEYIAFVRELVNMGDIMNKRFFIVIPYDPITNRKKGFYSRVLEAFSPAKFFKLKKSQFEERRQELDQRVENIEGGLNSMGITSVRLDTQGLIEMYYGAYNPDQAEVQKLEDINKQRIEDAGVVTT